MVELYVDGQRLLHGGTLPEMRKMLKAVWNETDDIDALIVCNEYEDVSREFAVNFIMRGGKVSYTNDVVLSPEESQFWLDESERKHKEKTRQEQVGEGKIAKTIMEL
jgi:hypothetical protein